MKTIACTFLALLALIGPARSEDVKIDFERAKQLFQKQQGGETLSSEEKLYLEEAKRQHEAQSKPASSDGFDWARAKALHQRVQGGETLSGDDQKFYEEAKRRMESGKGPGNAPQSRPEERRAGLSKDTAPSSAAKGLVPLNELSSDYHGRDGGLYGGGKNEAPAAQQALATKALAEIKPLDADGKPGASGKIVMMSIGMSNTTMEFSAFVSLANADARKASNVVIVDCAQGGKAAAQWASVDAPPWGVAEERLKTAGVTAKQVQVLWVKQANIRPSQGTDAEIKRLQDDVEKDITIAKQKYPNARLAFLSSRIYAGYAQSELNPEPYAYESAFAVRGLIAKQMSGDAALKSDKAPVLLWGPYLWASGMTPRKSDGLVWSPEDFAGDGTHPGSGGREKVAKLLLDFFTSDANAKSWFVKRG